MKPIASFLVPAYNESKNIKRCIDSLTAQTVSDFEIIAIDDGSTDNTHDILMAINDPRLKVFKQENIGRTNTRNKTLSLCTGKYIILQDADDWSEPNRLKLQLEMAESICAKPVIGCGIHIYNQKETIVKNIAYPEYNRKIRQVMSRPIKAGCFHPPTMLALKSHIEEIGGWRPKFKVTAEDGDLICRLYEDKDTIFGNVPEYLYNYNLNVGSVTNVYSQAIPYQMFKRHCKLCRQKGIKEPESFESFMGLRNKSIFLKTRYFLEYRLWCIYYNYIYR